MTLSFSIWQTHQDAPKRLDAYVARCLDESRNTLKTWFSNHKVLMNQQKPKPSVHPLDQAVIDIHDYVHPSHRTLVPNHDLKIPILFQDEHILIMNKPRGISVNALNHEQTDTIANFLLSFDPNIANWDPRVLEPGVVHRLDQWTSGCLIGVRTPEALTNIQKQFQNRRVTKFYLALVEGILDWSEELIDHLIHDPRNHRKMKCLPKDAPEELLNISRRARLSLKPLKTYKDFSLLEVRLFTGRMHQIRVQCASRRFPLAGDKLYGAKKKVPFEGQWLHAQSISFFHPIKHKRMTFQAPVPKELSQFLATCEKTVSC